MVVCAADCTHKKTVLLGKILLEDLWYGFKYPLVENFPYWEEKGKATSK